MDLNTIKEAIEVLKHLNPRPGARFTSDNIPYVVPDILVERNEGVRPEQRDGQVLGTRERLPPVRPRDLPGRPP